MGKLLREGFHSSPGGLCLEVLVSFSKAPGLKMKPRAEIKPKVVDLKKKQKQRIVACL